MVDQHMQEAARLQGRRHLFMSETHARQRSQIALNRRVITWYFDAFEVAIYFNSAFDGLLSVITIICRRLRVSAIFHKHDARRVICIRLCAKLRHQVHQPFSSSLFFKDIGAQSHQEAVCRGTAAWIGDI